METIKKRFENVGLQTRNILQIYRQATEDELLKGSKWYHQAHEIADLMAVKYNLTIIQSAGIISALSPGTSWSQNIIDANHLCTLLQAGKNIHSIVVTTYGNNRDKAYSIYSNNEITEAEVFRLLLGASKKVNKTSSFFLNILHPDQSDILTIDRHAFRINLGIEDLVPIALTEKRYQLMSKAYRNAAKYTEYNAIELQAITWLVFRRLFVTVRKQELEDCPF